ncbi:hypothetical protein P280DRAFT_515474 [Massarina eburnea CBS 473.64]|uniref:Uncharacterized protein n=1 Tax=Massarina eburnea CBS 473.64 TaxID=1395130 RepID=A0A6A6S709_9PLEO|nr:hypothetical protein P280DRAFT_515474 [Massarina eburnea CBS 473.64]
MEDPGSREWTLSRSSKLRDSGEHNKNERSAAEGWQPTRTMINLPIRTLHEATSTTPEVNLTVYQAQIPPSSSSSQRGVWGEFLHQGSRTLDVSSVKTADVAHSISDSHIAKDPVLDMNVRIGEKSEVQSIAEQKHLFKRILGDKEAALIATQKLDTYFEGLVQEYERKTGRYIVRLGNVDDD